MTDTRHPGLITPDNAPADGANVLNDDGSISDEGRRAILGDIGIERNRMYAGLDGRALGDDFFVGQWDEIVSSNPDVGAPRWRTLLRDDLHDAIASSDSQALRATLMDVVTQLVACCEVVDVAVAKKRARLCASMGCVKPIRARGYCIRCYGKRRASGELDLVQPRRSDDLCIRCHESPQLRRGSYCRSCASEYERLRRQQHADEINRRKRETYDPARNFIQRLRYVYGMTQERYDGLLLLQHGTCAICQREAKLHVDHDHACCPTDRTCGRCIRGLLCPNCNNGLGRFGDDPDVLERAAAYLRAAIRAEDIDSRTEAATDPKT